MTLKDAYNVLHVDEGDNAALITTLVDAVPDYIEVATGLSVDAQDYEPLCDVVGGLLLTQWYYSDHADDQSLTRTINALLKAITLKARDHAE